MSLYSIIGIVALLVVVSVGAGIKIVLSKRREKLDGCHGFLPKEGSGNTTDDWENL